MTKAKSMFCSMCGNKYSSLWVCPECDIPLTLQNSGSQSVEGDDNQLFQNTGIIHGNVRQERLDAAGNEIAKYITEKTGELGYQHYKGLMLQPRIAIPSIGAILFGALNITGIFASILSFFGLTAAQINLAILASWILFFILAAVPVFTIWVLLKVLLNGSHREGNQLLTRTPDFGVSVNYTTARCPVKGCSGYIELKKPLPNEEGITLAGFCTKKRGLHIFDFDEETQLGRRIRLTPKKESK